MQIIGSKAICQSIYNTQIRWFIGKLKSILPTSFMRSSNTMVTCFILPAVHKMMRFSQKNCTRLLYPKGFFNNNQQTLFVLRQIFKNRMFRRYLFLFVGVIIISSSGCFGVRPGSSSSGKNLFETFYIGKEGSQYFIKPLKLKGNQPNLMMKIDFTFRYKDEVKDTALVNFSLYHDQAVKAIRESTIQAENTVVRMENPDLIFIENDNKLIKSRFTAKLPVNQLVNLFKKKNWKVNILLEKETLQFQTPTSTERKIDKLQNKLFSLIN